MAEDATPPMQRKDFVPLPDYDALLGQWAENYDRLNYGRSLSNSVLTRTHALIEKPFGPERTFDAVLEVGAGTMAHLHFVRHRYGRYIASDHDPKVIAMIEAMDLPDGVEVQKLSGNRLPFADDSFDRLIATHVLEHVPDPHLALQEWVRVVRPGGVISLILPCDPGLAWRFGRMLGPRAKARAAGLEYDYFMAREHINAIFNLRQLLKYHFPRRQETWWPLRVPLPDLNLIYAANLYV